MSDCLHRDITVYQSERYAYSRVEWDQASRTATVDFDENELTDTYDVVIQCNDCGDTLIGEVA